MPQDFQKEVRQEADQKHLHGDREDGNLSFGEMTGYKFKLGDLVQLVGIYRKKGINSGIIIERFEDIKQASIGGSIYVYKISGVGTYGEGALEKA